jgi:hypothetical protein
MCDAEHFMKCPQGLTLKKLLFSTDFIFTTYFLQASRQQPDAVTIYEIPTVRRATGVVSLISLGFQILE